MFQFTLITIGRIKNKSLASLCEDFTKRLTRQGKFEQIELKDGTIENEGARILETLSKRKNSRIYALAEEGTTYTSTAFANELLDLQGKPAVFIIGGAYGLSQQVKAHADNCLSLSPFTFTHEIARMLLCEQLYRAVSINTGSNYHHA
jgi:23S rRNA (pseudouridine1915-N3)-methyltransferase